MMEIKVDKKGNFDFLSAESPSAIKALSEGAALCESLSLGAA